ncbi:MAG: CNNM domain-containing protein, partial [Paracoccaceae bacterium]
MDPTDPSMIDSAFWLTCGGIALLLVLSGFFSGSETALTAASRGKLKSRAERGEKGAQRALEVTEDNERLIGSVLLGNNLVNILATSLATALLTRVFGESGVALATLVMTLLVLIFAEVLPKTYAISNSETAASLVARPIGLVVRVLAPIVTFVRFIVRRLLRMFGVQIDADSQIMVREEIAGTLQLGHSEGTVEKEDRDRILGALDLGDRTVEEIMLHRRHIEMIDADLPPQEVLELCLNSAHTRLPIYRGEQENIIGVLHAKDLLRSMYARATQDSDEDTFSDFDLSQVAMKPYFVPETTTLDEQMR